MVFHINLIKKLTESSIYEFVSIHSEEIIIVITLFVK